MYIGREKAGNIGPRLIERVKKYFDYYRASGLFEKQLAAHSNYYGRGTNGLTNSADITRGGSAGQLKLLKVNHLRNLGQHLLQLTTSQKPAPQPVATNSDAKSQKQVTVAKGILEYYNREKRIGDLLRRAAECAILYSEGFVKSEWDGRLGNVVASPEGGEVREGDIAVSLILPVDVARDEAAGSFEESNWVVVRNWKNRYDIAAQFGLEDAGDSEQSDIVRTILGQQTRDTYTSGRLNTLSFPQFGSPVGTECDIIAVYEFFHKRTASVPNGRYVSFLEDGTVLSDQGLQYKTIPVRRICPGVHQGTPFGYTPIFDLLGMQKAIDALYSAVLTNQMTFGVQSIMSMKGSDIDFRMISNGLGVIEYSMPDYKPEAVNFTQSAPEVFQYIQQLEGAMETISGVNSVVRGNPEASLKSGSALALVQSQAIQFSSGLQESYQNLVQDVFTDILNILKVYAKTKRVISVAGKFNRTNMLEFTGESIEEINRVVVNSGSSLEQTLSGRIEIARDMLQNQLIKRPEEYIAVLNTGRLDPMIEGENSQLMLIRSENEDMGQGKQQHAVPTDDHALHIKEHAVALSTPESRNNPELIKIISDHMTEHVQHLADPALVPLLTVLGQQPLATAMQPEPGQGYAPGQEGSQDGPKDFPQVQGPMPRPNMPVNPATGLRWDPQTGGGAVVPDSAAGANIKAGDSMPLPAEGNFQAS